MSLRSVKNRKLLNCFENCRNIATSSVFFKWHGGKPKTPTHFLSYNDKIYPPQEEGELPRPAFVCHAKFHIKYSPDKLWYVACMVRGLSIEEAIQQCNFVPKKGSLFIKQTLQEAQKLAVEEHNVEYKTNLWVAESFVGKGMVIKGVRRHALARFGVVEYKYAHYFVCLEEGKPPKHYYPERPNGKQLLENYIDKMRNRTILVAN